MKVADIKNVAGIGGGVIGGSWAVLNEGSERKTL